jgi:hypothetical protein
VEIGEVATNGFFELVGYPQFNKSSVMLTGCYMGKRQETVLIGH